MLHVTSLLGVQSISRCLCGAHTHVCTCTLGELDIFCHMLKTCAILVLWSLKLWWRIPRGAFLTRATPPISLHHGLAPEVIACLCLVSCLWKTWWLPAVVTIPSSYDDSQQLWRLPAVVTTPSSCDDFQQLWRLSTAVMTLTSGLPQVSYWVWRDCHFWREAMVKCDRRVALARNSSLDILWVDWSGSN